MPVPSAGCAGRYGCMRRHCRRMWWNWTRTGRHRWSPVAPGARIEVEMDSGRNCHGQGHAYFDTNDGDEPLEEGFSGWHWCRAPTGARGGPSSITAPASRMAARSARLCITTMRRARPRRSTAPPEAVTWGGASWGVARATRADSGCGAACDSRSLEDTPFYARSVIDTRIGGRPLRAVHESLSMDRFVAPWVQVLLPFKAPRWG